ncbi:MAG: beta-galactosidase [Candidatus Hydrogenedentes bacterium]|nr:beta-galactosidase [Candidatus Hydrogenedentota bacterium]
MRIGVDYYPEQCDESCWAEDIALMRAAEISVVRMAEFAWSRLEPAEGSYEFSWLDRILDKLHAVGIQAVLGTPTATPPAWLHARFPEIFPADKRQYRLGFGTREQRCLNNPDMRAHGRRIVEALARHYAKHPAVIGWQTDNELAANLCYCPICADKFRTWLKDKYGFLEAVNAAWGTAFWSQEYSDWSHIPLPWEAKCGDHHNPSLQLEFRRFQSQSTVEFQQEQIDIIRKHAPNHFITHNLMGTHSSMDYYELARNLDFVSWDNYPINPWSEDPFGSPLAADVMRGIKQRNVWVMEQQNGITGWNTLGRRPTGEWLRCAAWQTVAHGADTVVFFRWRTAAHGTEQYWHGVLNHDGKPRRRFREVAAFGWEMRVLSDPLDGTEVRSDVAILNAYDQHYAFEIQPQAEGLSVWRQVGLHYTALKKCGLNVDVIPPNAELGRYRLLIAPSWYILSEGDAARLTEYVRQGGTLILNARTGVKDCVNACRTQPLPTLLGEMAGIEVDDYDPLGKAECTVRISDGREYTVAAWADALTLNGASAIAHYTRGVFAGEPAITCHEFGLGCVYYFGTFGEAGLYDALLGRILDEASIGPRMNLPEGVDANWREKDGARFLILCNFNPEERTVAVPGALLPLLGEAPHEGSVVLPAYGVGVYEAVGVEEVRKGTGPGASDSDAHAEGLTAASARAHS